MTDGDHMVWVVEDADGFADELHHTIASSGDVLGACWSTAYDGPVIAVLNYNDAQVDRTWVFTGDEGSKTWLGLDPATIAYDDVRPLPFMGYEFKRC